MCASSLIYQQDKTAAVQFSLHHIRGASARNDTKRTAELSSQMQSP